ncbi:MAG: dodecin family protein [Pyrinomonadaceae bacterium]|jgi:flavin-binding protein dodecin
MSVAKNIEITASSPTSFEDAIESGIRRASKSLKNIQGAWIKEQKLKIENNQATEYRVMMILTFVLNDSDDVEDDDNRSNKSKSGKDKK